MSIRNTENSYGWLAKFFHWVISPLIIVMLIFGFFLDKLSKDFQPTAYNYHKLTGLLILTLVVLRILWTVINPKPKLPEDTLLWQRIAEHVVQGLMYVSIFMMPLVGWLGASYAGYAPHLGQLQLKLPVSHDLSKAELFFKLHELFAFLLIGLLIIHVSAALYHHIIKKDMILKRMLP